jgi:PAS domain S-box-containing protein
MILGADDYIRKDRLPRLSAAIDLVLRLRQTEKEKLEGAEKLKRSEENYRTIMERISDGFVALDKDGYYTYVNKEAGEIIHRKPEELIGKHIATEFSGEVYQNFHYAYLKAIKEQQFISIEEYFAPFHIWLEAHIYPSADGLSIFFRDITERKKAERAIIESEEKYRTLVDQAFDSIIIYTPDLIILDCNDIACSITGYTREELKAHIITELFFEDDIIARPLYFGTLKAGQHTLDYRRLKRKDGSGIEVEIGTKMMPDANLMAVARDITERKKAEQKIIRSETNLRTIFENTSEGFLLLDSAAVIMAFNNKAGDYSLLSREKEIQTGQSIYDCIEESRRSFFQEIIAKALSGESIQFDRSYEMKNGATAWIHFSATPVIETGQVKGICITGQDITEKKLMEQEIIAQKIEEQKKIARAIIKAQEKERNHLGQELHDNINQILASVKLYLSAAGQTNEEIRKLIGRPIELINSSIDEIRSLCSNLVTPFKDIDLEELIRDLLRKLAHNAPIKTDLTYSISNESLPDDLKLNIYRILQEQLNNIAKHANAKEVNVSVQADSGSIRVVVLDDGKGFDLNEKRKGIGISNMINRIESFNGTVAIESSPGKGCRIMIKAPY